VIALKKVTRHIAAGDASRVQFPTDEQKIGVFNSISKHRHHFSLSLLALPPRRRRTSVDAAVWTALRRRDVKKKNTHTTQQSYKRESTQLRGWTWSSRSAFLFSPTSSTILYFFVSPHVAYRGESPAHSLSVECRSPYGAHVPLSSLFWLSFRVGVCVFPI